MYRTILLPLDGSALAERAVPYASTLAQASGARLLLLQATHIEMRPGRDPAQQQAHALHAARDYLAGVAAQLDRRILVETVVFPAGATEAIRQETQVRTVDLIVMTPHSHPGPGRGLYGRVATATVRRAEVPVLLIPTVGEGTWPHGRRLRMLVPLDGCDCIGAVLRYADDLAAVLHAEVLLLKVEASSRVAEASASTPPRVPGRRSRAALEAIVTGARSDEQTMSRHGAADHADTTLATIAPTQGADMVALPMHTCGSVPYHESDRALAELLQHAGLPLLLVGSTTAWGAARPTAEAGA